MPLTETSANVRRNGSLSRKSTRASSKGQSPKKVKPDAVSSMLRTSTETGDVGQFSIGPSRLPRLGSRLPPRRRSGSVNAPGTSFTLYAARRTPQNDPRRLPRPGPPFPALSRQDTVRSNLTSYHSDPRRRVASRVPHGSGRRTTPATASGLYSHPSFISLRGPPSYRPVSPAFSEGQSMFMYNRRPSFHRAASAVTAASSPAPIFHREYPYYQREGNHSGSSSVRLPSPAIPGAYAGVGRSPYPSRRATPVSASLHNSARRPNASVESFHSMPRSATGSTTPMYYDYTEAFAEVYSQFPEHDAPISPFFSADHAIPEQEPARPPRQAQTPFGMVQGSVFKPSEMPTPHNRTQSEQGHQIPHEKPPNQSSHEEQSKSRLQKDHVITTVEQNESNEVAYEGSSKAKRSLEASPQKSQWISGDKKGATDPPSRHSKDHPKANPPQPARRSSRSCTFPSSPSTSFFPNASRNSHEVTSLAACVQSPTLTSTSVRDTERAGQKAGDNVKIERDSKSSLSLHVSDWQLPSLNFRPLSFLRSSQEITHTSGSSGLIAQLNPPTIISPTPERPMSSQSRRRLSKILGIQDSYCWQVNSSPRLSRSFSNLNTGKLKRVAESSEMNYPARYSIPPFSPRNSLIAESGRDNESNVGSTDQEQCSRCEKSTIESLLDKHIECLGLQPEIAPGPVENSGAVVDDGIQASTISTSNESTIKIAVVPGEESWAGTQNANHTNAGTISRPAEHGVVPKRPRLAAAHSSPCVSKLFIPNSSDRPSLGWNTLASTSKLSSARRSLSEHITSTAQRVEASSSGEAVKQLGMSRLSPSASSYWSGNSADVYDWSDEVPLKQRSHQQASERQVSQRRKMRMRLKLKRNSQSQGKLCESDLSSERESFHTARAPSQREQVSKHDSSGNHNPAKLEIQGAVNFRSQLGHTSQQHSVEQRLQSNLPPTSPVIPNRRSSVVGVATYRVKHSIDMARKMSVKTTRSHRSNVSIVEPLNSSRVSALAPHLATPDLGPSLTPMSLNMNFAFPPANGMTAQGLRATQSFFSDDSSAVRNPRSSLRKRFNLPSLRSVLPSSPRAHSMANIPGRSNETAQARLHHSCQMQGLKQKEEEQELNGTVGMSEFAYCKRKMLERVKGWWRRRQCVQRKLGLKRRRGEDDQPHGQSPSQVIL